MAAKKRTPRQAVSEPSQETAQPAQAPADLSAIPEDSFPSGGDTAKRGLPIVGIGASAGGLVAFKKFFTAMPADGALRLTGPVERRGLQTSIDFFLRSLAEDQQERAICIILSGTGSHGSLGLKAVKANGGMAMVQDPKTAEYDRMPLSARADAAERRHWTLAAPASLHGAAAVSSSYCLKSERC